MTEIQIRNEIKLATGNWQIQEKLVEVYCLFSLVWNLCFGITCLWKRLKAISAMLRCRNCLLKIIVCVVHKARSSKKIIFLFYLLLVSLQLFALNLLSHVTGIFWSWMFIWKAQALISAVVFARHFFWAFWAWPSKDLKDRKRPEERSMFLFDAVYLEVLMKFFSAVVRDRISFQQKEKRKCHLIDWGRHFLKNTNWSKKKYLWDDTFLVIFFQYLY